MKKIRIIRWLLLVFLQSGLVTCDISTDVSNDEKHDDKATVGTVPVSNESDQVANILSVDGNTVEITGTYNTESDNSVNAERWTPDAPGHMKKLGEQGKLILGEIPVLDVMIGGEDFYEHFIRKRQPVVFKGVMQDWESMQWKNESYLLEKYADILFDVEMGKVYKTSQHPRKTMTLREFLVKYKKNSNMYLDSPFPQSTMMNDMEVPLMMQCDELYTCISSAHLLYSNGSSSSPLHYDSQENFLSLISGEKVAYLAHYNYSDDLYIDDFHDFPNISPVNPENVDLIKYPNVSNVPFHKITMEPGDMLYIPQGWYHQVRSYDSPNIAVSIWFSYFKEDADIDVRNPKARLANIAKIVGMSSTTIQCKNQAVSMVSVNEITLKNIADEPKSSFSLHLPADDKLINNTVLYDLVSPSDAVLYVGSDDHWIYAVDMFTGKVKWKVETREDTGSTCAFKHDGSVVYCGADDTYMRAIHISNGSLEWAFKTDGAVISSAIVDELGLIYFGSVDGYMYNIFPNGTLKWKTDLSGDIWSSPVIDWETGIIYVAGKSKTSLCNMFALKQENGDIIWKKFTSNGVVSSPKLNIRSNEVYFCDMEGNVFVFESVSGTLRHKFNVNDTDGIPSTPAIHNNETLFILSASGKLTAFKVDEKRSVWEMELGRSTKGSNSSPYVGDDDMLYIGAGNGTVYCINPGTTGIVWKTVIGSGIFFSSPRLGRNGMLYIGSVDGPLYALNSKTGEVIWTMKTDGPLVGTPLITREFT